MSSDSGLPEVRSDSLHVRNASDSSCAEKSVLQGPGLCNAPLLCTKRLRSLFCIRLSLFFSSSILMSTSDAGHSAELEKASGRQIQHAVTPGMSSAYCLLNVALIALWQEGIPLIFPSLLCPVSPVHATAQCLTLAVACRPASQNRQSGQY